MQNSRSNTTRRSIAKSLLAAGTVPLWPLPCIAARTINTRPIPTSGKPLPVIGLGTWQVFDVGAGDAILDTRAEIISIMRKHGATVIDSSPMYGRAEAVVGTTLGRFTKVTRMFLATKVWTEGRTEGLAQMRRSFERMQTDRIDLMQVHNLLDLNTQLASVRGLQEQGKVRYTGITHYRVDAHQRVMEVMRAEPVDFVQINYSIATRAAEDRLLPLAADKGIAVMVNRPFERGALFSGVKGKPLPPWATELEIDTWGQFFLKYIVSHRAVTVAIPATSSPAHMLDNLGAAYGRLPDAAERKRMVRYLESI